MSKPTELSKLEYGKWATNPGVRPISRPIKVLGFDTETGKDGNITVLACSDETYELGNIYGNILQFLTKPEYSQTFNFFFNLGFDHNAVFRSICTESMYNELLMCNRTEIGGYLIEYIPNKLLKIRYKKKTYKYFDISQFYKGGLSGKLTDVYKSVFNKEYHKIIDASKDIDCIDEEVIKYCILDSQACQELAENLVIPTNKIVPMRNWYSGATIAKNLRKKYLNEPYKFNNNTLQQYAMYAYGGARIEVFQRGSWGFNDNEKLYMYDIRSAYPSVQCELFSVNNGERSSKPEYLPESLHSFFNIDVKIDDCILAPLKYRFKNVIYYPKGNITNLWIDKNEIELLNDFDVKYTINKAIHDLGLPEEKPYSYLKELYQERLKYKNSENLEKRQLDYPLKLGLNSSYGMLIERTNRHTFTDIFTPEEQQAEDNYTFNREGQILLAKAKWKAGMFFNPVHACEVTSAIRCKIYRDSIKHESNLIKFATDSITFDKKVNLSFGEKLGEYEDSPEYRGCVIGSGVYSLYSQHKNIHKFRSFNSQDLADLAAANGEKAVIEIIKTSPVKLKESRHELFKWFNTFQEKRKKMDINFDHRRKWFPQKLKDMNMFMKTHYLSKSLDYNEIINPLPIKTNF